MIGSALIIDAAAFVKDREEAAPIRKFGSSYRAKVLAGDDSRWIRDTRQLQLDHPKLRLRAMRLTQLMQGPRERARACHQFVKALPFQFDPAPHSATAVDTLCAGAGDAASKSVLLVALLRSAGIASRIRVVVVPGHHLRGIVNYGNAPLVHPFAEVLVDEAWLAVDSYCMDTELEMRARSKLWRAGLKCGCGTHVDGAVDWDASCSAFSHFHPMDEETLPIADLGTYDDLQAFCDGLNDPLHAFTSSWWGMFRQRWGNAVLVSLRHRSFAQACSRNPATR